MLEPSTSAAVDVEVVVQALEDARWDQQVGTWRAGARDIAWLACNVLGVEPEPSWVWDVKVGERSWSAPSRTNIVRWLMDAIDQGSEACVLAAAAAVRRHAEGVGARVPFSDVPEGCSDDELLWRAVRAVVSDGDWFGAADGCLREWWVRRHPPVRELVADALLRVHWDGTGCGTHDGNACAHCFGPSPMTVREVAEVAVATVHGVRG